MTLAFQDEAGLRQAGAFPSGHSGAWWAVAEKAAKYWAVAQGVAPAPGQAESPWRWQALAQAQAGLALPVQGSALPEDQSWKAQVPPLPRVRPLSWVWARAWWARLRAQRPVQALQPPG